MSTIKIENDIKNIMGDIDELHEKLDHIINLLESDISVKCDKMNDHIYFIEGVYDSIKNPLGYMCEMINSVIEIGKDYSYNLLPSAQSNDGGGDGDRELLTIDE